MADIVNLKRARKTVDRTQKQITASGNAAKFGRTKVQKLAELDAATKTKTHLDNHKLEDDAK
ncbi:MAG: hypothetical protein ACI861_002116 [Paracoccaceae bacterium]